MVSVLLLFSFFFVCVGKSFGQLTKTRQPKLSESLNNLTDDDLPKIFSIWTVLLLKLASSPYEHGFMHCYCQLLRGSQTRIECQKKNST